HVRGHRGYAEREQGRERDQCPRAHDHVDGPGGHPRGEHGHHLEEGHCAGGASGESPPAASAGGSGTSVGPSEGASAACAPSALRPGLADRSASAIASSTALLALESSRSVAVGSAVSVVPMSTRLRTPPVCFGMPTISWTDEPRRSRAMVKSVGTTAPLYAS